MKNSFIVYIFAIIVVAMLSACLPESAAAFTATVVDTQGEVPTPPMRTVCHGVVLDSTVGSEVIPDVSIDWYAILPDGWYSPGEEGFSRYLDTPEDDLEISWIMPIETDSEYYLSLSHVIARYNTTTIAIEKFGEWQKACFSNGEWKKPPQASYPSSEFTEAYELACVETTVEHSSYIPDLDYPVLKCRYLRQHENLVTLFEMDIVDNLSTYSQFETYLILLEKKLQEYHQ